MMTSTWTISLSFISSKYIIKWEQIALAKICIRQKYLTYVIFGKFISLVGLGLCVFGAISLVQFLANRNNEINIQKIELEKHT